MLEHILAIVFEPLTRPITTQLEGIMATVEELNAKVDTLTTRLEEAKTRIEEDVAELRRLIEEQVDPAELQPISDRLDQLIANVQQIDPSPEFPPES